jgi:hypothetical protein
MAIACPLAHCAVAAAAVPVSIEAEEVWPGPSIRVML